MIKSRGGSPLVRRCRTAATAFAKAKTNTVLSKATTGTQYARVLNLAVSAAAQPVMYGGNLNAVGAYINERGRLGHQKGGIFVGRTFQLEHDGDDDDVVRDDAAEQKRI